MTPFEKYKVWFDAARDVDHRLCTVPGCACAGPTDEFAVESSRRSCSGFGEASVALWPRWLRENCFLLLKRIAGQVNCGLVGLTTAPTS